MDLKTASSNKKKTHEASIYYQCTSKSLSCWRGGVTFYWNSVLMNEAQPVQPSFLAARETHCVLLDYIAIKRVWQFKYITDINKNTTEKVQKG